MKSRPPSSHVHNVKMEKCVAQWYTVVSGDSLGTRALCRKDMRSYFHNFVRSILKTELTVETGV